VSLQPRTGVAGQQEFRFATSLSSGTTNTFKRYADADLVESGPTVSLAGLSGKKDLRLVWLGCSTVLLGGMAWFLVRKKFAEKQPVQAPRYKVPGHLTPFSVIELLKQMNSDKRLSLNAEQKKELRETISDLEVHYFGPSPSKNGHEKKTTSLEGVARKWISFVE
jgi:hypothetical protein